MEGPQGAGRACVVKRPLDVTWHEQVEDNGQVYISISSEEEERDDAQARRQERRQGFHRNKEGNILIIDSSSDEGDGGSYGIGAEDEEEDKFVRVKRKLRVLELEEEEEEEEEQHQVEKKVVAVADRKMKKKWRVTSGQNVGCEQHHVPGVRKRRLGEEDAAFLLFYGNRKTPSATTLRSVIGACCLH